MDGAERYVNRLRYRRHRAWIAGVVFLLSVAAAVNCFYLYANFMQSVVSDTDIEPIDLVFVGSASQCAMLCFVFTLFATFTLGMFLSQFFWSKDRLLVELWDRVKKLEAERNGTDSPESR